MKTRQELAIEKLKDIPGCPLCGADLLSTYEEKDGAVYPVIDIWEMAVDLVEELS